MRYLFVVPLLLVLAGVSWRYRDSLHDVIRQEPVAVPVVFDNGSARDSLPQAVPDSWTGGQAKAASGLRKCVRRTETIYTNSDCPEGFKEREVKSNRVSVIPANRPPAAATASTGPEKTLHNALGLDNDERLRERMTERAIDGSSR